MSKHFSEDIVTEIINFLNNDDWNFDFEQENGLFRFNLSLKGKMKKIRYIIDVDQDSFNVYGICDIGPGRDDRECMARLAEYFSRVNYGMRNGCFELDFRDGEIRFRTYVDCDDCLPSAAVIKNSIYVVGAMYERYAPGILAVLFADADPAEAYTNCRND